MTAPAKLEGLPIDCPACKMDFIAEHILTQRKRPAVEIEEGRVAWTCPKCREVISVQPGFEPLLCDDCQSTPPGRSRRYDRYAAASHLISRDQTASEGCAYAACQLIFWFGVAGFVISVLTLGAGVISLDAIGTAIGIGWIVSSLGTIAIGGVGMSILRRT